MVEFALKFKRLKAEKQKRIGKKNLKKTILVRTTQAKRLKKP